MIQINDYDLPITAADKIICGTKPVDRTPLQQALVNALVSADLEAEKDTQDMYTIEEIEEIAKYLTVYCETHKNGE